MFFSAQDTSSDGITGKQSHVRAEFRDIILGALEETQQISTCKGNRTTVVTKVDGSEPDLSEGPTPINLAEVMKQVLD